MSGPRKKMISCVRPGVFEVRANAFRPVSALISEDFPALERPAKAISSPFIGGKRIERAGRPQELPVGGEQLAPGLDLRGVKPVAMLLNAIRVTPSG